MPKPSSISTAVLMELRLVTDHKQTTPAITSTALAQRRASKKKSGGRRQKTESNGVTMLVASCSEAYVMPTERKQREQLSKSPNLPQQQSSLLYKPSSVKLKAEGNCIAAATHQRSSAAPSNAFDSQPYVLAFVHDCIDNGIRTGEKSE